MRLQCILVYSPLNSSLVKLQFLVATCLKSVHISTTKALLRGPPTFFFFKPKFLVIPPSHFMLYRLILFYTRLHLWFRLKFERIQIYVSTSFSHNSFCSETTVIHVNRTHVFVGSICCSDVLILSPSAPVPIIAVMCHRLACALHVILYTCMLLFLYARN